MQFLTDERLTNAICEVVQGKKVRLAVAFWGRNAHRDFRISPRSDWRIICNLSMGGTNPDAIRRLEDPAGRETSRIRHCPYLHAKVYLSEAAAVITSANASANGLGFEGTEVRGWREAGVRINDASQLHEIQRWFDRLWKECDPVNEAVLDEAKRARRRLRSAKASLGSLSYVDPDSDDFPLLEWWVYEQDFTINKENVRKQAGYYDKSLEQRINDSIELESERDLPVLSEGRWVLRLKRRDDGVLSNPTWARISSEDRVIRKAYNDGSKDFDVVLFSKSNVEEPFRLDRGTKARIARVLRKRKFHELRRDDYRGAWFAPRERLMREFWRDLKNTR